MRFLRPTKKKITHCSSEIQIELVSCVCSGSPSFRATSWGQVMREDRAARGSAALTSNELGRQRLGSWTVAGEQSGAVSPRTGFDNCPSGAGPEPQ